MPPSLVVFWVAGKAIDGLDFGKTRSFLDEVSPEDQKGASGLRWTCMPLHT